MVHENSNSSGTTTLPYAEDVVTAGGAVWISERCLVAMPVHDYRVTFPLVRHLVMLLAWWVGQGYCWTNVARSGDPRECGYWTVTR